MHLIDARAAYLSDYSYPITKSSHWTAVIGHLRDNPPIMYQTGARRTNHNQAFCYRYDYVCYLTHDETVLHVRVNVKIKENFKNRGLGQKIDLSHSLSTATVMYIRKLNGLAS